jgi:hypothetical protein
MDIEKLKTLVKHILFAFCGVVFFTVMGYGLRVANSPFSGMSNYFNGQSFGNTFYLVSIIFVILMSFDAVFILIERFGADSLIDFIMNYIPR